MYFKSNIADICITYGKHLILSTCILSQILLIYVLLIGKHLILSTCILSQILLIYVLLMGNILYLVRVF